MPRGGRCLKKVEKLERTEALVNFKRAINKFLRIVIDVLRLVLLVGNAVLCWWSITNKARFNCLALLVSLRCKLITN